MAAWWQLECLQSRPCPGLTNHPPACVSALEKQISVAAVLVLLILEGLQVRSSNRVSVIVGGLTCLKQRNQTKRFLQGEDMGGWSLPHWWYMKQRIAKLLYRLDALRRCSAVLGTADCSHSTATATATVTACKPCGIVRKGNEQVHITNRTRCNLLTFEFFEVNMTCCHNFVRIVLLW